MEKISLGFIGGGKIAKTFLLAFQYKKIQFKQIIVSDIKKEKLEQLCIDFPEIDGGTLEDVVKQDVVIITLHPPALIETLEKLNGKLNENQIIVSLSSRIKTTEISQMLGGFSNIACFFPNASSAINRGYNPACYAPKLTKKNKKILCDIFSHLGTCFEVDEDKLEGYAILTAMGPSYFWFQLYEMDKLGANYGLSKEEIKVAITNMINGSLHTMFESGLSREEIFDLIPVRPLAEVEDIVSDSYDQVLTILSKKLKV